jgi:hypothetical protein
LTMAKINKIRMVAAIEGDFVVFLIGMRINRLWKIQKWLPVVVAMPRMLKELSEKPEAGLLGFEQHFGLRSAMVVQYWRSFDQLEAYARNKNAAHFPAWAAFNKNVASNGDVGIWHETYLVPSGQYESIYNNMPEYGLGKAASLVAAAGKKETARGRLGD